MNFLYLHYVNYASFFPHVFCLFEYLRLFFACFDLFIYTLQSFSLQQFHLFKHWQSLWASAIGRYTFWLVLSVLLQPIRCRPHHLGAWSTFMQMTATLRRVASYRTALWHRLNSVSMDTEMLSSSSCQCQVSVNFKYVRIIYDYIYNFTCVFRHIYKIYLYKSILDMFI